MLVQLIGPNGGSSSGPAEVDGPAGPPPAELPPVAVDTPPVTPEADAACPEVLAGLPLELTGEPSRTVRSESPYAYAWGEPPIVLVCGVDAPEGFVAGAGLIQIEGVQWFVDTSDPESVVWTTVDRPVHVQVRLPASVDSAPVTALSPAVADALPYREPAPPR